MTHSQWLGIPIDAPQCRTLEIHADSADHAWTQAAAMVRDRGHRVDSRAGEAREAIGARIVVHDARLRVVTSRTRRFSPSYAAAEMLWYLSGEESVERVAHYAPQYRDLAHPDGTAPGYAYGARLGIDVTGGVATLGQLEDVISILGRDPGSRQAIAYVGDPTNARAAYQGRSPDVPCTIALHFLIRGGALHLSVAMRSNDLWLGLPYDLFCFTTLQAIVAGRLGVPVGSYFHLANSLHLYERDREKVAEITPGPRYEPASPYPVGNLGAAVVAEGEARRRGWYSDAPAPGDLAGDLFHACSLRLQRGRYTCRAALGDPGLEIVQRVTEHRWAIKTGERTPRVLP